MQLPWMTALCVLALGAAMVSPAGGGAGGGKVKAIADKTLVAWASLADLAQRGGSVLTLENPGGQFDAIVFGEKQPRKWMAGSDSYRRTEARQDDWPAETADPATLVQIAVVYKGPQVSIYRDGKPYASYTMTTAPVGFSSGSIVVIGLRHMDARGGDKLFHGAIDDARVYASALTGEQIASLKPKAASEPQPLAWWTFDEGQAVDRMGTFAPGRLVGEAKIAGGKLNLAGGYMVIGVEPPRGRSSEPWPTYHIAALPDEGVCRPYDTNGCLYWKGRYHLMYIFQHRQRGHSWGHMSSEDLVHWTYHPAALVPQPGDPDRGIFSGNAFVNKDGAPMLCWFGIDAGVCVATAEDDTLLRWKKHPKNPIIPIPRQGQPGHGVYKVWDPYLWLEGDTYYCLLGGNTLPNGKDTLYLCRSTDLVNWTPLHPFYEHPDLSWTTGGEDCSCPDFFRLGDRHVLMCISHKVGGRFYVGRFDKAKEKFLPERHVRMNWPGGNFFAPESLLGPDGRRVFWAWVTDPRFMATQRSTGSGVMSLPRVLSLEADGSPRIAPAAELEALRRNPRAIPPATLAADAEATLEGVCGDTLELAAEFDPGQARRVGLKVRCSPDGREETGIWYDPAAKRLLVDMSRSTLRTDVAYNSGPLSTGRRAGPDDKHPQPTVEAPLELAPGETLKLRVFLDRPMLEVFANDRQCITQQVFPDGKDSLRVKACAEGGQAKLLGGQAWDMAPAKFVDRREAGQPSSLPAGKEEAAFQDPFDGKLADGWSWLREDPKAWRIKDGGLEIRVQPGVAGTVRNALLRAAPDRRKGTWAIDVTVTNHTAPTQQYEQAGITWYHGGRPVFKLVKELINGKTYIIPGRKPMPAETVQLRLLVTAAEWTAQYRPDGEGEFLTAGKGRLPAPGEEQVSIQCYNGPADAEHWIRFDDVRITKMEE